MAPPPAVRGRGGGDGARLDVAGRQLRIDLDETAISANGDRVRAYLPVVTSSASLGPGRRALSRRSAWQAASLRACALLRKPDACLVTRNTARPHQGCGMNGAPQARRSTPQERRPTWDNEQTLTRLKPRGAPGRRAATVSRLSPSRLTRPGTTRGVLLRGHPRHPERGEGTLRSIRHLPWGWREVLRRVQDDGTRGH